MRAFLRRHLTDLLLAVVLAYTVSIVVYTTFFQDQQPVRVVVTGTSCGTAR